MFLVTTNFFSKISCKYKGDLLFFYTAAIHFENEWFRDFQFHHHLRKEAGLILPKHTGTPF